MCVVLASRIHPHESSRTCLQACTVARVAHEKPVGSGGYKFQKPVDEAVAFQADVQAEHEAHGAIGGDSSQDGAASDGAIQVAAGAGGSNVD